MPPIHVSPEEAVQVHLDINSKQSVTMHFGTFPLADDGQGTAERELKIVLNEMKVSEKEFMITEKGMTYVFNNDK